MEIWKDIEEFKGYYQVSNYGRVRSLDRIDSRGCRRKGALKRPATASSKGYAVVCLGLNGKQYMRYVHRLVATEFINEIPKTHVVNHIDYDVTNNKLSNLEIITRGQNSIHAIGSNQTEKMVFI